MPPGVLTFTAFGQIVDLQRPSTTYSSGLTDGVLELVSTADHPASAIERDHENNSAGVIFRLSGDRVEELSYWAPYGADRFSPP